MLRMILDHKAYWLLPVMIVFVLLILLTVLASFGGGASAPFIYTLF
jgi:hypothetical protein